MSSFLLGRVASDLTSSALRNLPSALIAPTNSSVGFCLREVGDDLGRSDFVFGVEGVQQHAFEGSWCRHPLRRQSAECLDDQAVLDDFHLGAVVAAFAAQSLESLDGRTLVFGDDGHL
jgi:hypothetical protein